MKKILLCLFMLITEIGFSMRDPFTPNLHPVVEPLKNLHVDELIFVGAISTANGSCGFVSDVEGNVYQLFLQQKLGKSNYQVFKILTDRIVLLDKDQHYIIIN